MTREEMSSMGLGDLLLATTDPQLSAEDRLEAKREVVARLPSWDCNWLSLDLCERAELRRIARWAGISPPAERRVV